MNVKLFAVAFFFIHFVTVDCEIFSAIGELEILAHNEHYFLEELQILAEQTCSDYVDR